MRAVGAAWAINGLGQPIAPMSRFFGGVDCGFGFFSVGFGFGRGFRFALAVGGFFVHCVFAGGGFCRRGFPLPKLLRLGFFLQIEQVVALITVAGVGCGGARPAFGNEQLTQAFATDMGFDVQTVLVFAHRLNL